MNELISRPATVTIHVIQARVAVSFGVSRSDLVSPCRARRVARPRQVAMFLARQLTPHSLAEIGRAFGGRDHTTVMHAVARIDGLVDRDPDLAVRVARDRRRLLGCPADGDEDPVDAAAYEREAEIGLLVRAVADRGAAVERLEGDIAELRDKVGSQCAEIAKLRETVRSQRAEIHRRGGSADRLAPKRRACLKCHAPIESPYPGL